MLQSSVLTSRDIFSQLTLILSPQRQRLTPAHLKLHMIMWNDLEKQLNEWSLIWKFFQFSKDILGLFRRHYGHILTDIKT